MLRTSMSLSWELDKLRNAIEAARILSYELANQRLDLGADKKAPAATEAVLALVNLRLRDLRRALSGDLNPKHLFAPHNDKTPELHDHPAPDPDLYLDAWGINQKIEQLAAEFRRIVLEGELDDEAIAQLLRHATALDPNGASARDTVADIDDVEREDADLHGDDLDE